MQAHFFTFFHWEYFFFLYLLDKIHIAIPVKKVLTNWPPSAMIKLR